MTTKAQKFRAELLDFLVRRLPEDSGVVAIFEGGSAAHDRVDEWSDIDLAIVCKTDQQSIFGAVETALRERYLIAHKVVEKTGIWEDVSFRLYFFKDAPDLFFLDLGVIEEKSTETIDEFMNVDRHGTWLRHYDPKNLGKYLHQDPELLTDRHRKSINEIAQTYPVNLAITKKAIKRGSSVEAFAAFQAGLVRPLVTLWGIKYRPSQFDFGLRYTDLSFPDDKQKVLSGLLYLQSPKDLIEKMDLIEALYQTELAEIRSD